MNSATRRMPEAPEQTGRSLAESITGLHQRIAAITIAALSEIARVARRPLDETLASTTMFVEGKARGAIGREAQDLILRTLDDVRSIVEERGHHA